MDFVIVLPPSKGFTVIMVVVDRLFGHFVPMKSDFSSDTVVDAWAQFLVYTSFHCSTRTTPFQIV